MDSLSEGSSFLAPCRPEEAAGAAARLHTKAILPWSREVDLLSVNVQTALGNGTRGMSRAERAVREAEVTATGIVLRHIVMSWCRRAHDALLGKDVSAEPTTLALRKRLLSFALAGLPWHRRAKRRHIIRSVNAFPFLPVTLVLVLLLALRVHTGHFAALYRQPVHACRQEEQIPSHIL